MRVLVLGTLMDHKQGGANQALMLFANRLAKHPLLTPIVYLYSYESELLDPSITIIRYNAPRSYRFLWRFPSLFMVSQLRKELEKSNLPEVDVAICCSPHLAAAYKKLRPQATLITYLGAVLSSREIMEEFPASRWVRNIEAWLSNRVEGWVYRQPRSAHLAQTKLVAQTREHHFGLSPGFFTVCPGGSRITFAGWVHQPVDWLAAADVFVLTSRVESFGLVYAEAMMMGLPCIGSAHDPPEITSSASDVIPEGEVGFCVNSGAALLERLRFLRDNSEIRAQMGRKAEQLARNHYGIDNFIECIERTANALNAPKSKAI
jgi:glycosyltransferase involved in cell wall biosynthesis